MTITYTARVHTQHTNNPTGQRRELRVTMNDGTHWHELTSTELLLDEDPIDLLTKDGWTVTHQHSITGTRIYDVEPRDHPTITQNIHFQVGLAQLALIRAQDALTAFTAHNHQSTYLI